jgi:hypothetical protein
LTTIRDYYLAEAGSRIVGRCSWSSSRPSAPSLEIQVSATSARILLETARSCSGRYGTSWLSTGRAGEIVAEGKHLTGDVGGKASTFEFTEAVVAKL